jgi:hypothetical protein
MTTRRLLAEPIAVHADSERLTAEPDALATQPAEALA